MLERGPSIALLSGMLLLSGAAIGQDSVQMRVSAVVPPRPCTFPDRCDEETVQAPAQQSNVTVKEGKLTYVGSPPEVSVKDDLMTITF